MGTQARITDSIKNGILSGNYTPGQLLESRAVFVEKHNTTPLTVQRAFNHLIEHEFVTVKDRSGTYISEKPSNLCRYALVFCRDRKHADWTRFWQLMIDEKSKIEKKLKIDIEIYEGMKYGKKSDDYARFLKSKKAGSFAGVIFTSELFNFPEEILENLDIPYVAISFDLETKNINLLKLEKKSFHKKISDKIAELNVKKVAIIATENYVKNREDEMKFYFDQHGLSYCPNLVQSFFIQEPYLVNRYVSLLLSMPDNLRPDCFAVFDDNLLPYVFDEITSQGKTIGKDIKIVSHANLPIDCSEFPGVEFVGYDVPAIIRKAISLLKDNTRKPETHLILAKIFDNPSNTTL